MAVFEKLFRASDYFEYCALHEPRYVDVLVALRAARSHEPAARNVDLYLRVFGSVPRVDELISRHATQRHVHAELASRAPDLPATADEAEDIWHAAVAAPRPLPNMAEEIACLLELAERRFAVTA
jgi:hypothetical protein